MKWLFLVVLLMLVVGPAWGVEKYDVVEFLNGQYNYAGFTEKNSYKGINSYVFDKEKGKWHLDTYKSTCPPEFLGCGKNWSFKFNTWKKPDENVLYFAKTVLMPGRTLEVFWYNKDWIYNFQEPFRYPLYSEDLFGTFHPFHHLIGTAGVEFPSRGALWSKRYMEDGEEITTPVVQIGNYIRMKSVTKTDDGRDLPIAWPYESKIKAKYMGNYQWDYRTWDGKKEESNLPEPFNMLVVEGRSVTGGGEVAILEKYYYGRSGSNSFGLVRFDQWHDKKQWCGTDSCCSGVCDGDLVLTYYNTNFMLKKYANDDDPKKYFQPSFYSDPKLETEPTNGALVRSRFKTMGEGASLSDGRKVGPGNWVSMTEILTDADWMLASVAVPTHPTTGLHCPDGYPVSGGSFVAEFADYQGVVRPNVWAIMCGTNDNVLLSVGECPSGYVNRGWFDVGEGGDYKGRKGSRFNYCVDVDETKWEGKKDIWEVKKIVGDFNGDKVVNLVDLVEWKKKYLAGELTLKDLVEWKRGYLTK
jgi:hypothetical protein